MKVISYGNYQGSRIYNGDVIGFDNDMCFVMDGSTALFNDYKFFAEGDLYTYMQMLKRYFVNDNNKSIQDNLKNAINLCNDKIDGIDKYKEYELPTYTICVIRDIGKYIEYYILCDTLISILYKDGRIENIVDRRIDPVKVVCRNRNREIKEMDITEEEKKKLILENEQETRKKVNIEGGFPVGSTNNNCIDNGYFGKIEKDKIDRILICSDGYYDNFYEYPKENKEFDSEYVINRINNKLDEDVRDDTSYILIEI